ncbi:MAG: transcriptional regulator, LacI family [Acidimicrobiaceae bacterium]|nr:transcriptional regulator, LacI family [Acidimicrobiaceae bacterium]
MAPSDQQPTIKEVARLAGVAPSSVSRALNDHPDVSPEMRARVMEAVEELRYEPDFLAQSLRLGSTRTIGFIVSDISNPLFAGIVKGAEQELESHGYSILLMNSLGDPMLEAKHIGVLRQRRVDGFILSLQSETNSETLRALRNQSTPVVLLDREIRGVATDAVLFDHSTGVAEATSALLKLGHRKINFIVGSAETRGSRDRLKGFQRAYAAFGISSLDDVVIEVGSYSRDFGFEATKMVLERDDPPTAIIAANSQIGVGTLAALNEHGLRHGEDVSLVICDDVELLRLMDPPVSVVARDAEKMGTVAAELLLARMQEPESPLRSVVLPTLYIHRGSTVAPRNDRRTATAARDIRRP